MKRRSHFRRFGNEQGQSFVEFSLCVFLLVMLFIGVVEIGRLILVYTTVANAARAGARYAIVQGADSSTAYGSIASQVTTVVRNYLSAAPMTTANALVSVCPGATANPCGTFSSTNNTVGSLVTVAVSYSYDPFTTYFPLSVSLASTSQGVITY